ncbi:MAG: site-specific integrase [Ruminococcus sp.]|nr:site-specific integrase [Ruminococcus sp.]
MDVLSMLGDGVRAITITGQKIISEKRNNDTCDVELCLSLKVLYDDNQHKFKSETIGEYVLKWLEYKRKKLKPTSFDRLDTTVTHQIIPILGDVRVDELTTADIEDMIRFLKEEEYSYSTVKKAYEAIRACMRYAVSQSIVDKNPADQAGLSVKEFETNRKVKFWTDTEMDIFQKEALKIENGSYKYRFGNCFVLLMTTGIRVGEAIALQWSDVDFDKRQMNICKNIATIKNRGSDSQRKYIDVQQSTKTRNGNRKIPLNDLAISALNNLQRVTGNNDRIIDTTYRSLDRAFKVILKNCNLPRTGMHTLRHSFASKLFRLGVDIKIISDILGHSDISITYDTYVHVTQEQKMKAVEKI